METITQKKALDIFFSSSRERPVSIVFMHYNGRTRTSRGPVKLDRVCCRPLGANARGRLLGYRDLDTGSCRIIYQACLMYIDDKKITLKGCYR